jgi:hypothetical protein
MQLSTLQSQIKMMPNLRDDLTPKNAIIFGDESADETAQRVLAVAGLMGSEEQWDVLVKKWSGGGSSWDSAQTVASTRFCLAIPSLRYRNSDFAPFVLSS